jgi:hypothetical protein
VINWAFVLFERLFGPVWRFLYVLGCREPLPGLHEQYVSARWRQALGSTMRCVAGDGIGILVGALIGALVSLPHRRRGEGHLHLRAPFHELPHGRHDSRGKPCLQRQAGISRFHRATVLVSHVAGAGRRRLRLSDELVARCPSSQTRLTVRPKGVKKKMDMADIHSPRRFPSWPGFTSSCSQPACPVALTVGCGH